MANDESPPAGTAPGSPGPDRALLWSEFRMLTVLVIVVAGIAVFVLATGVFLLAFASVLMALLLHDLSAWVGAYTPLSRAWSLAVVFLILLAALGTATWFAAPAVLEQGTQVFERIPQAFEAVDEWMSEWLGVSPRFSARDAFPDAESLIGSLPMIVTTTFGAVGSLVVVVALGVYLAAHPEPYRDGAVRLFAPRQRENVARTLDEIGHTLRRWLWGQVVAMVVMGILAYVSLRLLGVPLALGLALATGILEFVPYIGAIVAAVPVVLVALTESWNLALYALAAYVAIQMIEGYAMVPLIQERAILLPPGLIVFAQVLMGVLFGVVGIVLATPMVATVAVVVQRCYVEAVLEADQSGR
ncbi:MAG: AI-2E family transporter [Pseudomonadota bacterium]